MCYIFGQIIGTQIEVILDKNAWKFQKTVRILEGIWKKMIELKDITILYFEPVLVKNQIWGKMIKDGGPEIEKHACIYNAG